MSADAEQARVMAMMCWYRAELEMGRAPDLHTCATTAEYFPCLMRVIDLQGCAGSGKTWLILACVEARYLMALRDPRHKDQYSTVLSASSAKGAQQLGPTARTVHSICRLNPELTTIGTFREDDVNREVLERLGMLVEDEIGMLGSRVYWRARATGQVVRLRENGAVRWMQVLAPGFGGAILMGVGDASQLPHVCEKHGGSVVVPQIQCSDYYDAAPALLTAPAQSRAPRSANSILKLLA
jgi:hypothetical protein